MANSYKQLRKNGSLVFGTRNRLFNILSMNQYTLDEINNNNLNRLAHESVKVTAILTPSELLDVETVDLEPATRKHTNTGGIEVTTRFQFTPAQLVKMLHAKGFTVKELCPVHIHGVTPAFAASHKEVHYNISNLLSHVTNEDKTSRYKLIPFASSFMVHAVK